MDQKISELRLAGVLQDMEGKRLDPEGKGIILVSCGDGDRFPDIFHFQAVSLGHERIHPLTLNGGALLLPQDSPLLQGVPSDLALLKDIRNTPKLKQIGTIALYAHWPCGQAGAVDLPFVNAVDLLVKAKARVKTEIPDLRTASCFFHIDRGDCKRTYHVSLQAWKRWRSAQTGEEIATSPAC